jgi:hypothetical protein
MSIYDRMLKMDRRYIYFLVALAVIIPLLKPMGLPISVSPPVQSIYDKIDKIPPGGHVVISLDYDPSSKPELYPMTIALFKHCFKKNIKVLALTLWPTGASLGETAIQEAAKPFNKVSGDDYVYFGYKAGFTVVIVSMGESIKNTFPVDFNQKNTSTMKALQGIDKLHDCDFVIDLAAGASVETWIAYGEERYKFPMGAGCTAVSATQYYPYINTGQLVGLIGGLKGAAEYEKLVNEKGLAISGMDAQSIVHLMTVIIVIFTNILFFISRKSAKKENT